MALSYLIPQEWMTQHFLESQISFEQEDEYEQVIKGRGIGQLDNLTDARILGAAYYNDDESPLLNALSVPRLVWDKDSLLSYMDYLNGDETEEFHTGTYARYWHGYVPIMKILLCLFNYSEIRIANMFAQMLLFTCLICLLYQRIPNRVLPFTLGVLTLTPIVLAMSLQFSPCYYVSVIAGILLLWQEKRIIGKKEGIFFLLVGMGTCYFDFLTYPSVTFAIPLMILISLKNQDWKCDVKDEIVCGIHWCVGYVGLWAGKWILGSTFLDENIIADAISQIRFRSGYEQDITYVAVLIQNLKIFAINRPYWVLALLFIILAGYQLVQGIRIRKIGEMFREDAAFLLATLIPFAWYFVAQNHSYVHSYFTARVLAISVIAAGCCLANNRKIIQRYQRDGKLKG